MKNILKQLSKLPEGKAFSTTPFATVDVSKHLQSAANSFGNVFSRAQAQQPQSNVYDMTTGNKIQLGGLDHIDPSLFDTKQLMLAAGQDMTPSQGPGFGG